jgi:hypothetical protein
MCVIDRRKGLSVQKFGERFLPLSTWGRLITVSYMHIDHNAPTYVTGAWIHDEPHIRPSLNIFLLVGVNPNSTDKNITDNLQGNH